jgi:hypothetical protein
MNRAIPYALILASLMAGCARLKSEDRMQELLDRPMPSSEQSRVSECARLTGETSRQKAIGTDAVAMAEDPFNAAKKREAAARAVKALDARQTELRCSEVPASAYSTPPADPNPVGTTPTPANLAPVEADASFDRCFSRCRRYTDRTKEQCFDVCSK